MPETPVVEPAASEPQPQVPASLMATGIMPIDDSTPKQWPAIMALLVGWLMPRTTARRLAHVGLLGAFAVQVAAGVLYVIAMLVLIAWWQDQSLLQFSGTIAEEFRRNSTEITMILVIIVAVVEASLILLALIVLPWGARDEKLRSCLYNAVRVVWLQTPQITVGLMVMLLVEALDELLKKNYGDLSRRHEGELGMYLSMLLGIWCIWGMLRVVGARPVRRRDDAAAICQCCGYNLFGAPVDGRCSECGELVADSIVVESRPGSLWQCRAGAGSLMTWWRCSVQSILHSRRLGRQLQVHRPVDDSWKLLVGHAVASGLIAAVGTFAWFGIMVLKNRFTIDVADAAMWFSMPIAAFWTGLSVVTVASVAAGFVGLWLGWTQGCHVMPASALVVSHLGGFLTLWVFYGCLATLLYTLTEDWHWGFRIGRWRYEAPLIVSTLSIVLNLAWIWVYVRLVYLAVSETRYATR